MSAVVRAVTVGVAAACCGVLASCVAFAPSDRAGAEGSVPERFSVAGERAVDRATPWWSAWESPALDGLEAEALAGNLTLREAWARLRQAEASARIAGAFRVPSVDVVADAGVTRRNEPLLPDGDRTTEEYTLGAAATYELDLWGRVRSSHEAARLSAEASRGDLDTAVISITASVADLWIQAIGAEEEIELLDEQVWTNEQVLELIELRFGRSIGSALDVYRQREALARARAAVPPVEARLRVLRQQLAVLTGRSPTAGIDIGAAELPEPGLVPETGLPAQLLAERPDIRAARLRLQAADWAVSSARADRLPAIRLTGRAVYGSAELSELFDGWLANLAAGLTGPVLDGGRRGAEVDRTRAVADERLAAYRSTVLEAIGEVEEALAREDRQLEYIRRLETQADAARIALQEAREQYLKGMIDYLSVLAELRAVQDLDRLVLVARVEALRQRVALHRALGGTWMTEWIPDEERTAGERPVDRTDPNPPVAAEEAVQR